MVSSSDNPAHQPPAEPTPLTARLGTIQGRLVPSRSGELQCFPDGLWDREMQIAGEVGFAHIEWLVPASGYRESPLFDAQELRRIRELSGAFNVRIPLICVDPILATPLWNDDAQGLVAEVARAAALIGAEGLVLPLLDASAPNDIELAARAIDRTAKAIQPSGLCLHLEVTAEADRAERLVSEHEPQSVGLCLDTGNLTRVGIDPFGWFDRVSQRVTHIHLKSVDASGKNVVFPEGIVDIPAFVRHVISARYRGCFTMETARGDDPVQTARDHIRIVSSALTAGDV